MTIRSEDFNFRGMILPALVPSLLISAGSSAVIPVIPAIATSAGVDVATAGLIAGLVMLGQVVGDIPSGWFVARLGEQRGMIAAGALILVAVTAAALATSVVLLGAAMFALGLASSVFVLARHAFMTTFVPTRIRARAISTLGGANRAGGFIGPFVAAGMIGLTGSDKSALWIQAACAAAVILLLLAAHGRAPEPTPHTRPAQNPDNHGLRSAVRRHGPILLRVGTGVAIINALRSCRTVLLPLWAVSLGISASDIALIVGIGAAVDFVLFYTSGQIMDRFGRLWSILPCMLLMSGGLFGVAAMNSSGSATAVFITIVLVMGLANGIGSGIVMMLGADLAPQDNPAPFLGAFRFTGDIGTAAAPLMVSAIVATASIAAAAAVVGTLGVIGAILMFISVRKYVPPVGGRPDGP